MQLRETGYKEIACSQELAKNRTIQGESKFPRGEITAPVQSVLRPFLSLARAEYMHSIQLNNLYRRTVLYNTCYFLSTCQYQLLTALYYSLFIEHFIFLSLLYCDIYLTVLPSAVYRFYVLYLCYIQIKILSSSTSSSCFFNHFSRFHIYSLVYDI